MSAVTMKTVPWSSTPVPDVMGTECAGGTCANEPRFLIMWAAPITGGHVIAYSCVECLAQKLLAREDSAKVLLHRWTEQATRYVLRAAEQEVKTEGETSCAT